MTGPCGKPEMLVIGVGNDDRGDDGIGLWVVRRLRERKSSGIKIRELRDDSIRLLDEWTGAGTVFVVDAMRSGGAAGALRRFEVPEQFLPARGLRFSTHGVSVADAVKLGFAVNRLPDRLVVLGIEGKDFGLGVSMSPEARRGAQAAIGLILGEIASENGNDSDA